eukprot:jgi/Ulvmu1/75/UM001_0078.1
MVHRSASSQGCRSAQRYSRVALKQRLRQCSRAPAKRQTRVQASAAAKNKLDDVDWDKVDWDTYDWRDYVDDAPGPAFLHTQQALEWGTVCTHIAAFASTFVGKKRCQAMEIARTRDRALTLRQETKAVSVLEVDLATSLDFGGISTDSAETALRRANKGGMLTGDLCLGVASLIYGAQGIQSTLRAARTTAQGSSYLEQIQCLVTPFLSREVFPDVANAVNAAITEVGAVRDTASVDVKRTRARVATLEGRLRSLLAKHAGGSEASTYRGRLCVTVPAGEAKGGGVVLGTGAGVKYVEPGAAVAMNNDLAAARAEAMSAEEGVLWGLTGLIIDRHAELAGLLEAVVWLDVASARHRYTEWIEGTYAEFGPFPWEHGASAAQPTEGRWPGASGGAAEEDPGSGADSESGADSGWGSDSEEEAAAWLLLKRLRHPLLHGWYLQRKAQWRQQQKAEKPKGVLAKAAAAAAEQVAEPEPVVPITWRVAPGVRSVVITGPNTGGKTAALKSLGLCVLLAMAGCGVPARAPARLPPFSAVLADIGDSQDLSSSLSTFSGHLRRISALRAEATDGRALVLLDEVGTGTDPQEGAALGAALLERLAEGGAGGAALTAATTHMSALTGLKFEDSRFENASAEFDDATLAPTYRLLWGVPGRSNALNIAARLDVPADVVEEAREVWGKSQAHIDRLVDELEGIRGDVERAEAALDMAEERERTLRAEVAAAEAEVAALRAEIDVTRAAIVGGAAQAAMKRLRRQLRIEEREAAEAEEEAQAAHAVAKKVKGKAAREQQRAQQQAAQQWRPVVGDVVEVPKLGTSARVEQVKGKKVTVGYGQMSITVNVSEVLQM